jgi:Transposase zinc-binding domain
MIRTPGLNGAAPLRSCERIDRVAWRRANAGHISLGQMKVMTAIERCRTAALGGHVARCENGACGHTVIGYNSCRNRRSNRHPRPSFRLLDPPQ